VTIFHIKKHEDTVNC